MFVLAGAHDIPAVDTLDVEDVKTRGEDNKEEYSHAEEDKRVRQNRGRHFETIFNFKMVKG